MVSVPPEEAPKLLLSLGKRPRGSRLSIRPRILSSPDDKEELKMLRKLSAILIAFSGGRPRAGAGASLRRALCLRRQSFGCRQRFRCDGRSTRSTPAPPYANGQFSNGPVWVQDLSRIAGLGTARAVGPRRQRLRLGRRDDGLFGHANSYPLRAHWQSAGRRISQATRAAPRPQARSIRSRSAATTVQYPYGSATGPDRRRGPTCRAQRSSEAQSD